MPKPHAFFFGYVSKVLAEVSASDSFIVKGHTVYLESGLVGGLGEFVVTTSDVESAVNPTCEIAPGVLVTCAIDEEGGRLRLVSAVKPEV